jgi:hypothetical protein
MFLSSISDVVAGDELAVSCQDGAFGEKLRLFRQVIATGANIFGANL